jgi:hypothetical protein
LSPNRSDHPLYVLAWVFAAAFWGGYRVGDLLAEGGDAARVENSDVSVARDLSYLTLRVRYDKTNASGVQLRVKRLDCVPGRQSVCPVAAWMTVLELASTPSTGVVECTSWLALWKCSTALPVLKKALPNLAPLVGFRDTVTLHSLRRGFVALGLELGVSETDMMQQTGHVSLSSFRRYTTGGAGRTRVAIEYNARGAVEQRRSDPDGRAAGRASPVRVRADDGVVDEQQEEPYIAPTEGNDDFVALEPVGLLTTPEGRRRSQRINAVLASPTGVDVEVPEGEFEIEAVIGFDVVGRIECFECTWVGYTDHSTWEPVSAIGPLLPQAVLDELVCGRTTEYVFPRDM